MLAWYQILCIQIVSIAIAGGLGAMFAHMTIKRHRIPANIQYLKTTLDTLSNRVEALEDDRKGNSSGHGKGRILLSTGETGSIRGSGGDSRSHGVQGSGKEREGSDR